MRREQGSVFVVTLAVMAGMVALIAGLAATNTMEAQAELNRTQRERAALMVEAGIQFAQAELGKLHPGYAGHDDDWASAGHGGSTMQRVGSDGFRIEIVDESSRVNLNVAPQNQLKQLPLTDEQIDSLLDWRESKTSPRPQGAKSEFYGVLPHPYSTKLQSFDTVDELLLVKGFSPSTLYAPGGQGSSMPLSDLSAATGPILSNLLTANSNATDLDPNGKQKVNLNSTSMQALMSLGVPSQTAQDIQNKLGTFQTMGDVMLLSSMNKTSAHIILDNFVVGGNQKTPGRLNANTATATTLETIPGITADVAQAIVSGQTSGYKTLGDLVEVPGMDFPTLAKSISFFCVGSTTFEARIMGVAGGTSEAVQAYLFVGDDGKVQLVRCQPVSYWHVRNRWGWALRTSDELQLGVGR